MNRRRRPLKAPLKSDAAGTQRKCIATGEIVSPEWLVRFALDPSGVVTPDFAARLPGRGAWVSARRGAVETAAKGGAFSRAFKTAAKLPDGASPASFADAVGAGLKERALAALGLARKAGEVVLGFDQAKDALKSGAGVMLISAVDAAAGGAEKLARLARDVPAARIFTAAAQSRALGREGVTHAVLLGGPATERFRRDVLRLEGFLEADDAARPANAGFKSSNGPGRAFAF